MRTLAPRPELHLVRSAQRIPELDGIRGIAILFVFLFHYFTYTGRGSQATAFTRLLRIFDFGWSGVDLFFVLSGFLIGGILLEARNSRQYFRTFYARRIYRIFPLYYLWLYLYLAVLLIGLSLAGPSEMFTKEDLVRFPRYLLFLQNFFYANSHLQLAWLSPTWSLAVEEQYYLVAPLLIRFLSIRTLTKVLLGTILLAPLLRVFVHLFVPHGYFFANIWMPCRADTLAMGMLGAIVVRSDSFNGFLRAHPRLLWQAILVLGVVVLILMPWYFRPGSLVTLTLGLSCLASFWLSLLLLVFYQPSGIFGQIARWRFLQRAGKFSYCLYLIHSTVNGLLHYALFHDVPRVDYWQGGLATLAAALLTWGIASLSWHYFEQPLLSRGHKYSY